jgi:hypothetical protein
MLKLRFDDIDYSVVVKNRRRRPNSWRWEIACAFRKIALHLEIFSRCLSFVCDFLVFDNLPLI